MTREEMEELKGLAASMGLYDDKNPCKRAVILGKAIQELEQEPVLDKIRAKIVELTKCPYGTECLGANCPSNTDCMICGEHVLEIIDKYKAESETQ